MASVPVEATAVETRRSQRARMRRVIKVPKWLSKEEVRFLELELKHNPALDDEEALRRILFRKTRLGTIDLSNEVVLEGGGV